MSRVSMKHTHGKEGSAADLLTVAPRLLVLSMESARDFVSRASDALPNLPGVAELRRTATGGGDCGCEIPETDCPPRCVCELHWEGSPGETFRATIVVRNTSKVARAFTIGATNVAGVTAGQLSIAPTQLQLAAGASANVAVSYHVPAGTPAGEASAEVLVVGAYEQCVKVRLTVQPEATITCEVAQGDPPKRVRTMHWYRHWQCEEPCAPPVTRTPQGMVPNAGSTVTGGPPPTGERVAQPVG